MIQENIHISANTNIRSNKMHQIIPYLDMAKKLGSFYKNHWSKKSRFGPET